jgi:RNA polymerase-binding transcription factor DksA
LSISLEKLAGYRQILEAYAARVRRDAESVARQALAQTGGQAEGGLSNAPLHLADTGTETYLQELSATLLENEEYLVNEASSALRRIDEGSFGRCARCGKPISTARLDALPFARCCTACATIEADGPAVNLNVGRAPGFNDELSGLGASRSDLHAAGTPAGGTAYGGLAGTNLGHGEPQNAPLESIAGSGNFEVDDDRRETEPQSGRTGGAVQGTSASKRGGPRKAARRSRRG